jgi:hypothetical protein
MREGEREGEGGREGGRGVSEDDAGRALALALPLTTSTPNFRGAIDHIWHSEGLEVAATLSLPYHAAGHDDFRYTRSFFSPSIFFSKKRGNFCSSALSLIRARGWLCELSTEDFFFVAGTFLMNFSRQITLRWGRTTSLLLPRHGADRL